ncbi:MAG: chemotaxis protein CheB [Flavobacterium sp.]|nr:chemotaxis protein CheB [Flavobacterium sp.]
MEKNAIKAVVIGGSAGSLEVLLQVLPQIIDVAFAIVIVMHRRSGDNVLLEELVRSRARIPVDETNDKAALLPGRIYIAPANYHLLFESDGRLSLDISDKFNFSRPSIDVTFESAADALGSTVCGLLLSGANSDGTTGLIAIKSVGGVIAIQDPEQAAMPYMPEYAALHARPDFILATDKIADWILDL